MRGQRERPHGPSSELRRLGRTARPPRRVSGRALRWEAGPSRAGLSAPPRVATGVVPPGPWRWLRGAPRAPKFAGGPPLGLAGAGRAAGGAAEPSRAEPSRASCGGARGPGGGGSGRRVRVRLAAPPPPSLLPRVGSERSRGETLGQAGGWGAAPAGAASYQRQLTWK